MVLENTHIRITYVINFPPTCAFINNSIHSIYTFASASAFAALLYKNCLSLVLHLCDCEWLDHDDLIRRQKRRRTVCSKCEGTNSFQSIPFHSIPFRSQFLLQLLLRKIIFASLAKYTLITFCRSKIIQTHKTQALIQFSVIISWCKPCTFSISIIKHDLIMREWYKKSKNFRIFRERYGYVMSVYVNGMTSRME